MSEQEIRVGDTGRVVRCNAGHRSHSGITAEVRATEVALPGGEICRAAAVEFVSRPRTAREALEEIDRSNGLLGRAEIIALAREALAALEPQP